MLESLFLPYTYILWVPLKLPDEDAALQRGQKAHGAEGGGLAISLMEVLEHPTDILNCRVKKQRRVRGWGEAGFVGSRHEKGDMGDK